ncbi:uncharacterized protein LOC119525729 [Choloepus didactylus]|uniref:uncharacterized protein LOC119525729 n=1 Tax=Choloepus didactylus TaxID=27675 RepID=UPI00189CBB3A|nr:uncharacterized protein LOC119525729 [Choloepus didactylus]XP_037680465.1 uncharacterized protein LOC119525729 [Choloepus didactylus]XP_037680466.1 uncharacterized protein LOC119525729 [Choloepus didactylus]
MQPVRLGSEGGEAVEARWPRGSHLRLSLGLHLLSRCHLLAPLLRGHRHSSFFLGAPCPYASPPRATVFWAARASCNSHRHCGSRWAPPPSFCQGRRHPLCCLRPPIPVSLGAPLQRLHRGPATGAVGSDPRPLSCSLSPRGRRLVPGDQRHPGCLSSAPGGPQRDDHGAERTAGEGSAGVQHLQVGDPRTKDGQPGQPEGQRCQHPRIWGGEAATGAHHRCQKKGTRALLKEIRVHPDLGELDVEPHFYEKGLDCREQIPVDVYEGDKRRTP